MAAKRLALFAVTILAACGGESRGPHCGGQPEPRSATRAGGFLGGAQRLRAGGPAPPSRWRPSRSPSRLPSPRPLPSRPRRPLRPLALASGTVIPTAVDQEINSREQQGGRDRHHDRQLRRDRLARPRRHSGRLQVTMTITEIHESENKGDKTGKLTLTPTEVAIGGRSYPLVASAEALDRQLKDRKTNAGDVAKVGAGAAVGRARRPGDRRQHQGRGDRRHHRRRRRHPARGRDPGPGRGGAGRLAGAS